MVTRNHSSEKDGDRRILELAGFQLGSENKWSDTNTLFWPIRILWTQTHMCEHAQTQTHIQINLF